MNDSCQYCDSHLAPLSLEYCERKQKALWSFCSFFCLITSFPVHLLHSRNIRYLVASIYILRIFISSAATGDFHDCDTMYCRPPVTNLVVWRKSYAVFALSSFTRFFLDFRFHRKNNPQAVIDIASATDVPNIAVNKQKCLKIFCFCQICTWNLELDLLKPQMR